MDPTGCPPNTANDFGWRYDTLVILSNNDSSDLRCTIRNVSALLGTLWALTIIRGLMSAKQMSDWIKREKRRKKQRAGMTRLPILPSLSILQTVVQAVTIGLFQYDLASTRNGTSMLLACAWACCSALQVATIFKKILSLGLRILPMSVKNAEAQSPNQLKQLDRFQKLSIGIFLVTQVFNWVMTIIGATAFAGQAWTAQAFWLSMFVDSMCIYIAILWQYERCIKVIRQSFPPEELGAVTGTRQPLEFAILKMFLHQAVIAPFGCALSAMLLFYGLGVVPFYAEMLIFNFGVDIVWMLLFSISTILATSFLQFWPWASKSSTSSTRDDQRLISAEEKKKAEEENMVVVVGASNPSFSPSSFPPV